MLHNTVWMAGVLGFALAAAAATAEAAQTAPSAGPPSVSAPSTKVSPAGPGARVEPERALGELNGRGVSVTDMNTVTDQNLTAVNTGNSITATNVGSGSISLQGDALSGFSGVGNFLMNTGHNNNLQSSMSVTIIIGP